MGMNGMPRRAGLVAVALAMVALGACGGSSEPAAGGSPGTLDREDRIESAAVELQQGGALVIGLPAETNGWNYMNSQITTSGMLALSTILEPLATYDADANAVPYLAESIEHNDDFTEWTVTTREGIQFSDGTPFDAAAVKANLDAGLSSAQVSLAYGSMFPEEGAVTVVDERTVEITLAEPWAVFDASFLAAQGGMMMSPLALATPDMGAKNPVGTGPFTFAEWVPGDHLEVKKNPNYWREGEPLLDAITFRILTDPLTMSSALQAGDVDAFYSRTADALEDIDPAWQLVKDWDIEPAFITPNTAAEIGGQPNPMANVHARRALAYATDRPALAEEFGGGATPPTSPFAPEGPYGTPVDSNGYPDRDIEQAKAEVAQYLEDTGDDSLSVVLTGGAADAALMQMLQAQWSEAGIEVRLDQIEQTAMAGSVVTGKLQLGVFSYYFYDNPDQEWHFWSSSTIKPEGEISLNFPHFGSPVIDENIAIGRENTDVAVRKEAYTKVVKELNANGVNIWTYWVPNTIVASAQVGGLQAIEDVTWANSSPKLFWNQVGLIAGG
jgi:peptide/nickel transport system substrate-binding protein